MASDSDNEVARKGVRIGSKILTGLLGIWAPAASDKLGGGINELGELFIGPEPITPGKKDEVPAGAMPMKPTTEKPAEVTHIVNIKPAEYDHITLQKT